MLHTKRSWMSVGKNLWAIYKCWSELFPISVIFFFLVRRPNLVTLNGSGTVSDWISYL